MWCLPSSALTKGGVFMTYFIGIDIAKYKHDCFIMDHNGEVIFKSFSFSNDKTGFNQFYSILCTLDPNHEKRIGFEATGHYGMNLKVFLEDKNLSYMEINPILIKEFSKATTLRRTKTDKKDASLIAQYLFEKQFITYPKLSYHINSLKSLTRARDSLVRERSLMLVKMTNVLDKIFPEFKPFFNNSLKSSTCLYLLKNYKCPSKIARMNSESYKKMSSELRRTISYQKFTKLRELAKNTIGKEDILLVIELNAFLDIYNHLDSKIKELEDIIEKEYKEVHSHIHTIKGIGTITAACIYAEYSGVLPFVTPSQMLAYAGLEPSTNESGTHDGGGHMVKHGSSYLRFVLLNAAQLVITHNPTLYDYYTKKRSEGKHHRVALSHVARKLVRIIFYLEKNNEDFDSNKLR